MVVRDTRRLGVAQLMHLAEFGRPSTAVATSVVSSRLRRCRRRQSARHRARLSSPSAANQCRPDLSSRSWSHCDVSAVPPVRPRGPGGHAPRPDIAARQCSRCADACGARPELSARVGVTMRRTDASVTVASCLACIAIDPTILTHGQVERHGRGLRGLREGTTATGEYFAATTGKGQRNVRFLPQPDRTRSISAVRRSVARHRSGARNGARGTVHPVRAVGHRTTSSPPRSPSRRRSAWTRRSLRTKRTPCCTCIGRSKILLDSPSKMLDRPQFAWQTGHCPDEHTREELPP